MPAETIPVTILSGNLGAGKTTLLNHLLSNAGDHDIAVLINDMGEVNIDAELIDESAEVDPEAGVTELSNGCICCELQDDLNEAVVRLARNRDFDALVVEASGISEPEPIARLFTTESRVAALYDVDAIVTVVDTRLFYDAFAGDEVPKRRGAAGGDAKPLSDLLIEQIEFSNVVLLNKADLCTDAELKKARALVTALQPDATILQTVQSAVDPDELLDTGYFEPGTMAELAGWKQLLAAEDNEHDHDGHGEDGEDAHGHEDHPKDAEGHDGHSHGDHDHAHPDEEYGVTSMTFRSRQPFDPAQIAEILSSLPEGIVRSKGTLWVANNDMKLVYSQAGPSAYVEAMGPWIASLPEIDQNLYRSNRPNLEWDEATGDRRTELVFIGTALEEATLREQLAAALVDVEATPEDSIGFPTDTETTLTLTEPAVSDA